MNDVEGLFAAHLGSHARAALRRDGCADFSLRLLPGRVAGVSSEGGWRLRVSLQRQRGELVVFDPLSEQDEKLLSAHPDHAVLLVNFRGSTRGEDGPPREARL